MAFKVTFRAYDDPEQTVESEHSGNDYFSIKDSGVLVVVEQQRQTYYSPTTWLSVEEPIE